MATSPNKLSRFLQEIKRRNVHRLMAVYGGTAFIIFEASTIIFPRWGLPDWTIDLMLYLLILGAIITFALGWIYDITSEGVKKTKPVSELQEDQERPNSNGWMIASYVSFVVILGLVAFNIFSVKKVRLRIDDSVEKSIAVLPFHNLSGDPGQEYICEGLTNEVISNLYKLRSFRKVVSFFTVLSYKEPNKNIQRIAEELGVNYILVGSYLRMGDKFKISVQLIEAQSDNHIWIEDYELPYPEVVGIPSEFALQIAEKANLFFSEEERRRIEESGTTNLRAYEIAQEVQYKINHRDTSYAYEDSLLLAIELDPEYADAYAGLGFIALMGETFLPLFTKEETTIWQAQKYLDKAIELDPDNFLANLNLGLLNLWIKWDYITAEMYFDRALQLTRDDPRVNMMYVEFLVQMNRLEDALAFSHSIGWGGNFKIYLLLEKLTEASKSIVQRTLSPDYLASPYTGEDYLYLNEYDSAMHYFELSSEINRPEVDLPRFKADMALAYKHTGNPEEAYSLLADLRKMTDESGDGWPEYYLGKFYSWTNELDSAFYFLEKASRNNCSEMPWLKVDPAFNSLKEDPRYWELYERTGHKTYDEYMASKYK